MQRNLVIFKRKLEGVTESALSRFASRARKATGVSGSVNVLITSSDDLRDLNRRFRRKDKATDVLSFSSVFDGSGGDIAISADIARDSGKQLGHGLGTELKVLILHGMLHLAGYDHETDGGTMARKERRLRAELGLPQGLIERNLQNVSARTIGAKKRGQSSTRSRRRK